MKHLILTLDNMNKNDNQKSWKQADLKQKQKRAIAINGRKTCKVPLLSSHTYHTRACGQWLFLSELGQKRGLRCRMAEVKSSFIFLISNPSDEMINKML